MGGLVGGQCASCQLVAVWEPRVLLRLLSGWLMWVVLWEDGWACQGGRTACVFLCGTGRCGRVCAWGVPMPDVCVAFVLHPCRDARG
jgi:hypothetical protein